jgi:hypothetical protein
MPEYFDLKPTRGRPRKVLNEYGASTVEKLAGMMCTDEEIASVMGVSVDTLLNASNKKTFSERKETGRNKGKASLRRMQYKAAEAGSTSMLIWLGKQFLGQTEKQETAITDGSITFEVTPASKG